MKVEYDNGVEVQGTGNAVASQNLAIVTFENPIFGTIRTAGTADEPLFCLADICRVLELQTNKVKDRLKQDGWNSIPLTDKLGRGQLATFINEQNLYRLVMRSDKPQAEPFQDWVCGEVLPQIRRTGGYIPLNAEDDDLTVMAKALQIMQRTLEQKDKLIEDKNRAISRFAGITHNALDSSLHYTIGDVAKELGFKTAGELCRYMEERGYVKKVGKRKWLPTDKLSSKFYHIEPYTYKKYGIEYEGYTFHLTEAFVTAMRVRRMKKNDNN